ncbi:MAG: hypothetical protein MUE69_25950 [Myxococcota bacterium]|jgi:hypothetical protein|nr:hypothetical protein [Myxococcota bacterium]
MDLGLVWTLAAMVVFVIAFVFILRHAFRANANQEAAWESAATQLGAERSDRREGNDRYVRLTRGACELEVHIALRGSSGGTASEQTRFRRAVRPPLPGLVVVSPQVHADAPPELVDALLPMFVGRALASSSRGVERLPLDELEAVGHPPMAERFDADARDAVRALRALGRCDVIADAEGVVVLIGRSLRDDASIVRWFEAVDRLGRALDASAKT